MLREGESGELWSKLKGQVRIKTVKSNWRNYFYLTFISTYRFAYHTAHVNLMNRNISIAIKRSTHQQLPTCFSEMSDLSFVFQNQTR